VGRATDTWAQTGSSVTIVVRPEDVSISAAHAAGNGLTATVRSVEFGGDTLRVQLVTDSGSTIVARLPKTATDTPTPQSRVAVSWRDNDATFVPANEGEGQ
jgi:ABC-type Fe3+/spermidine/putrescine transport system ATPase subunit